MKSVNRSKNSTSVKDYHLTDASLQYFVMKEAGYGPDKFFSDAH